MINKGIFESILKSENNTYNESELCENIDLSFLSNEDKKIFLENIFTSPKNFLLDIWQFTLNTHTNNADKIKSVKDLDIKIIYHILFYNNNSFESAVKNYLIFKEKERKIKDIKKILGE